MTAIAAAVTKAGVTMAADSECTTHGYERTVLASTKLWTDGEFIFGAAGGFRTAQVLRYHVDWPVYRPDEVDFETFLVMQVVPSMRYGLSGHGVVAVDDGVESLSVDLLIAHGDRLAVIGGDFCVRLSALGRAAIGSGYPEVLGHLGDKGPWKRRDVIEAVRRASLTAVGVGGPIQVADTRTLQVQPA